MGQIQAEEFTPIRPPRQAALTGPVAGRPSDVVSVFRRHSARAGADLSTEAARDALAEDVARDFGKPCSLLINNAGIVGGKPLMEEPDAKIRLTFNVNALAHFWTVKAFLPAMLEQDFGHVVTIASAAGMCGVPNLTDYCASKWAAMGFDEALRDRRDRHAVLDAVGLFELEIPQDVGVVGV